MPIRLHGFDDPDLSGSHGYLDTPDLATATRWIVCDCSSCESCQFRARYKFTIVESDRGSKIPPEFTDVAIGIVGNLFNEFISDLHGKQNKRKARAR